MGLKVTLQTLRRALRDIPEASIEREGKDGNITLRIGIHPYPIELLWAGQGWPSEVRPILEDIPHPWPRSTVVAAKSLSPGALALLREADANWIDAEGRARIVMAPALAIVRDRQPESRSDGSSQAFRWNPSAIELAELVLHREIQELRTGHLADQTGWSPGRISQILGAFDELGWTQRRGGASGRGTWHELMKPEVLLDAWAEHMSSATYLKRLGHLTDRDLLRFAQMWLEDAFGRESQDWALTTWAGLRLITPYATTTPALHVYVVAERFTAVEEIMHRAKIRPVDEGARVEFWEAEFRLLTQPGKPHPTPVASTPRLYADLLALGGRAADAAQHLRETVLGY